MIFYFPFTGEFFTTIAWALIIAFVACIAVVAIGLTLIVVASPFMMSASLNETSGSFFVACSPLSSMIVQIYFFFLSIFSKFVECKFRLNTFARN